MSLGRARVLLGGFAEELEERKARVAELEDDILKKSETLARLEQSHVAPVSATVSLVVPRISLQGFKLKPTQTRIARDDLGFPEVAKESSEASEIKPWLFLAGNIIARDENAIKAKGITRIINTAHTVCPNYFQDEFAYTSFELIDHPNESIDHFILNAIAEIERAREDNTKILVHCHQGISRSATLVIAYVAWKDDISVVDALMYVKARRKIVSPNSGFLEQLKHFEQRLRNKGENAILYHVAPHSETVATLVVKETKDRNRPLIDEDDVFLLYEGMGGDILIREPKVKTDPDLLVVAKRVAGWMVKYEKAFHAAKIVMIEFDDERFLKALDRLKPDA